MMMMTMMMTMMMMMMKTLQKSCVNSGMKKGRWRIKAMGRPQQVGELRNRWVPVLAGG